MLAIDVFRNHGLSEEVEFNKRDPRGKVLRSHSPKLAVDCLLSDGQLSPPPSGVSFNAERRPPRP
jgi:hypothetical protein